MNTLTSAATRSDTPGWQALLHRWPSALGLAVAVLQLAFGGDRESVAIVVGAALLCYLGAAALNRRWVAWAGIPGGTVVVFVSKLTGVPWWIGIGVVAIALVVVGLVIRAPRPALTAQTGAMLGYGSLAVTALFLAPRVGLVLAGLVLAAHGIWDLVHYRRDRVVSRSLAEFCMLLDVPLGVGVILLAFVG
jgi:hypothetical protein